MNRLAVINVAGLTSALVGEQTPRIADFARRGALAQITPAFPAVTCAAQSNYLTGVPPSRHGIVGNGWYDRSLAEIHFWKQSNHLVQWPKIWDELRKQSGIANRNSSIANLFWWFNMYSGVDYSITPRPIYRADGGKFFDIYSWPYSIRAEIKEELGEFPFFGFWGPAAGVNTPQGAADCVSRWIAAAAKWVEKRFSPTLNLIYVPHLDYNLQRMGTGNAIAADLRAVDSIVGDLVDFFAKVGVRVVMLSEYGITNVDTPIHLNRWFRQKGWLAVKDELGLEILDAGASKVFAVADHQVAHIYLNDPSLESKVRDVLEKQVEVDVTVLGAREKAAAGIDHPRAGRPHRGCSGERLVHVLLLAR